MATFIDYPHNIIYKMITKKSNINRLNEELKKLVKSRSKKLFKLILAILNNNNIIKKLNFSILRLNKL